MNRRLQLSNNIRIKYNRLFREVAKYYGMTDKITINALSGLDFILPTEFGLVSTVAGIPMDEIAFHMKEKFTYFLPFYKYYRREHFCQVELPDSEVSLLRDMNKVITKIRREESIKKVVRK